jgi:hypothetical protein
MSRSPEDKSGKLNYEAIAFFCATGFFPDHDTYFVGRDFHFDPGASSSEALRQFKNFRWIHENRISNLEEAVDRFTSCFEAIVDEQTKGKEVILPLSGGLDSRTLAVALKRLGRKVNAFSYRFSNGHDETKYGKAIAGKCHFPFTGLEVTTGYLWNCIDELAKTNHCYAEFTNPRQAAFTGLYSSMGDVFSLGHWGDVLFDNAGVNEDLSFDQQALLIERMITKRGGEMLAGSLWEEWNLSGTFKEYFTERVRGMLQNVFIAGSANASVRAFKSRYWATRWTSTGFPVYERDRPVTLPYFSIPVCELVSGISEHILSGRKVQIGYINKHMPELAKIPWQAHRPFNINNFHLDKAPYNLPARISRFIKNRIKELSGNTFVQRNWELQFLGNENTQRLKEHLHSIGLRFPELNHKLTTAILHKFGENPVAYAHPLSMLLTLSLFSKHNPNSVQ